MSPSLAMDIPVYHRHLLWDCVMTVWERGWLLGGFVVCKCKAKQVSSKNNFVIFYLVWDSFSFFSSGKYSAYSASSHQKKKKMEDLRNNVYL